MSARIEAAAKALLGYTGECVCDVAYASRNLIDPECAYHIVPNEEAARDALAAADAHDAAHGIHRVSLDEEKVAERAWNKLAERDSGRQWTQIGALNQAAWVGNIRAVLAAAVEAGQ